MDETSGAAARLPRPAPGDVTHVETWIFDLDNVLYPADSELFSQVDKRIGRFIADRLGMEENPARKMQKDLFHEHGTTLRGLMDGYDIDPEDFLVYVHDIDFSAVDANPPLVRAIRKLGGKKIVFTNGDSRYARRILERIGFEAERDFDGIFDIVTADYIPKPQPPPYEKLIRLYEIDPAGALFIEDIARNLKAAAELGMTTVWLPAGTAWSSRGADPAYVHYVIDNLTEWMIELTGGA